ncbi:MAG TPA: VOC family protein [Thermodesulfobacteriota bacterium]
MLAGIDHIVVLVGDLAEASGRYARLGFGVVPGGRHARGTHNALVPFEDGSYLELVAFFEPAPEHRWWPASQRGGGLVDVCLRTTDFAADLAAFDRAGLRYSDPVPWTRVRPDGYTLRWRLAFPPPGDLGVAPFLIEDDTPREARVPAAAAHANGVTGLAAVTIGARDPARAAAVVAAAAGRGSTRSGLEVTLGPHRLEYVATAGTTGPLAVTLAARAGAPRGPLDPGLTAGVRLVVV